MERQSTWYSVMVRQKMVKSIFHENNIKGTSIDIPAGKLKAVTGKIYITLISFIDNKNLGYTRLELKAK